MSVEIERSCKPVLNSIVGQDPDIEPMEYVPTDPENFNVYVRLNVGIVGKEGYEYFETIICSPKYLMSLLVTERVVLGRGYFIMEYYSYDVFEEYVRRYLRHCSGATWDEVVRRVSAIGVWEFADV